jgi:hypothetical protein
VRDLGDPGPGAGVRVECPDRPDDWGHADYWPGTGTVVIHWRTVVRTFRGCTPTDVVRLLYNGPFRR